MFFQQASKKGPFAMTVMLTQIQMKEGAESKREGKFSFLNCALAAKA